jgi:hypothetical protein
MIRWHWYVSFSGGATMPEFTTVSVTEAKLRTLSGRQKTFMNEYVDYIHQLHQGQAGKLRIREQENHATVSRRLVSATQALGINLIIKRSGENIYFWREERGEEQPRSKRRYTRRGRPGDLLPPQTFSVPEEVRLPEENGHSIPVEESPELGQTEQVGVDEAH